MPAERHNTGFTNIWTNEDEENDDDEQTTWPTRHADNTLLPNGFLRFFAYAFTAEEIIVPLKELLGSIKNFLGNIYKGNYKTTLKDLMDRWNDITLSGCKRINQIANTLGRTDRRVNRSQKREVGNARDLTCLIMEDIYSIEDGFPQEIRYGRYGKEFLKEWYQKLDENYWLDGPNLHEHIKQVVGEEDKIDNDEKSESHKKYGKKSTYTKYANAPGETEEISGNLKMVLEAIRKNMSTTDLPILVACQKEIAARDNSKDGNLQFKMLNEYLSSYIREYKNCQKYISSLNAKDQKTIK